MKPILVMLIAALLSGCAGSPLGDAIAGPEQLAQRDDAYCRSIGTTMGTTEYANCRMIASQQRANNHTASLGLMAAGAAVVANADPPVYVPYQPAPVRCRSVNVGAGVTTTCQ